MSSQYSANYSVEKPGVDATELHQYLEDLELDIEEDDELGDNFNLTDVQRALVYNDLLDDDESDNDGIDLPTGYWDEEQETESEEHEEVGDSDFRLSSGVLHPMSDETQQPGSLPPASSSSSFSDHEDHSEEVPHRQLTGMFPYRGMTQPLTCYL